MKFLLALFDLAMVATFIYIGVTVWLTYRKTTGTRWERFLATSRDSATILWMKLVAFAATLISQLDNLTTLIGSQEFTNFVQQYVSNPKQLASVMLAIAAVGWAARLRSLTK